MRLIRILTAVLALLGFAPQVFAHASLVTSDPADGSVLAEAPRSLELRFDEPVSASAIHLGDAAGKVRDDIEVRAQDERVVIRLPSGLPNGTQSLTWHVVSADGHPVAGSLVFSIGAPSGGRTTLARLDAAVAALIWLTRLGLYVGLFVGVGGAFFLAAIAQVPRARGAVAAALATGMLCAVISLGLQGVDLLGLQLSGLLLVAPWRLAIISTLGPSLALAGAAMLLAAASLRGKDRPWTRPACGLALLCVGAALAASGHAAATRPQWLTRPALFLHAIGVAYWIGALLPLALSCARPSKERLPILDRFSRIALPVVVILLLCGMALAFVELRDPSALLETDYGRILSAKLAAVPLLVGFAALNRFRLTRQAESDARPLARSIAVECVLALLILGLVAGWRFTPPPRAPAIAAETSVRTHIHTDKAMLLMSISPGRTGPNTVGMAFEGTAPGAFDPKEVSLTLSLPSAGIAALKRQAQRQGEGRWQAEDVLLPQPGRWHVRVDALVTDFEQVTLEGEIKIAP